MSAIDAAIQSAEDLWDKFPGWENENIRNDISLHINNLLEQKVVFEKQVKNSYIKGAIDARYDNDDSERYYSRTF